MSLWRRMSIFRSDINRYFCSSNACIHVWMYPAAFTVHYCLITACLCGLVFFKTTQPEIHLLSSWERERESVCVCERHEQFTGQVHNELQFVLVTLVLRCMVSERTDTQATRTTQGKKEKCLTLIGKRLSDSSIHFLQPSSAHKSTKSIKITTISPHRGILYHGAKSYLYWARDGQHWSCCQPQRVWYPDVLN